MEVRSRWGRPGKRSQIVQPGCGLYFQQGQQGMRSRLGHSLRVKVPRFASPMPTRPNAHEHSTAGDCSQYSQYPLLLVLPVPLELAVSCGAHRPSSVSRVPCSRSFVAGLSTCVHAAYGTAQWWMLYGVRCIIGYAHDVCCVLHGALCHKSCDGCMSRRALHDGCNL